MRMTWVVVAALLLAPGASSAQVGGESGLLHDIVLRVGERRLLNTTYRIARVLVGDESLCRAIYTVRSSEIELACSQAGQTAFVVHDAADQVRDRFVAHALGNEAWLLYEELRARLADIEGLSVAVDAPYVLLDGLLLSLADLERVNREASRSRWVQERATIDPFALVVLYGPAARFRATYEMLDEHDYQQWHDHKHLHAAIRIEDIVIMLLRTEGGFPDIEARARRTVGQLNQALLTLAQGMSGGFSASTQGNEGVLAFVHGGGESFEIVRATSGDAVGYLRRGHGAEAIDERERQLSPALVAEWWGRLAGDAADLYVRQRPPTRAAQTAGGGILLELYERTLARGGGAYSPLRLKEIIAQTRPDERALLEALGSRLPGEYLR